MQTLLDLSPTSKNGGDHELANAGVKLAASCVYFTRSLPYCQESRELVGLLKGDTPRLTGIFG